MSKEPQVVTGDDMASSYVVPTVVVNRFLVSTEGGIPGKFRIAFGENLGLTPQVSFRFAVQMTPLEAYELKEILETLLQPFQKEVDAIIKAREDGNKNSE